MAPLVLHTGVASLEASRAALPRVLPGVGGHRPPDQRHPARTAAGWSPSGRRWCGRSRPWSTTRATCTPGRVDRDRRSPPTGRPVGRRAAHRMARARGVAPGHARGDRRAGAARARPTPPRWPRATCGTSSATSTWSCRDTEAATGDHAAPEPPLQPLPTTRRAILTLLKRNGTAATRRAGRASSAITVAAVRQQLGRLEADGLRRRTTTRPDRPRGRPAPRLRARPRRPRRSSPSATATSPPSCSAISAAPTATRSTTLFEQRRRRRCTTPSPGWPTSRSTTRWPS